ncbi:hypothetical protein KA977_03305, partial [Candidatus Dependentiae bacterium]|nr:hypothetical protein [Candidatus Dependentiae bacterium]
MQKIILYFFLLLFFDYGILFAGNQNKIIVFYNSECDNCIIVKETVLVPLLKKENLNYEILDITFADTYMLFTEIEKITGDTQNFETPIVLFNNKLFSGKDEILNDFTDEIEYCRKNKIDGFYKKKITEIIEHKNNIIKKRFDIPYFFKKGCSECSRIEKDLQLIKSSNPLINIIKFNITDSYSTVLYESLCEKFGVNRENRLIVPAV